MSDDLREAVAKEAIRAAFNYRRKFSLDDTSPATPEAIERCWAAHLKNDAWAETVHVADTILSLLRERGVLVEWRSMESAPKDRDILLEMHDGLYPEEPTYVRAFWCERDWYERECDSGPVTAFGAKPIRWSELPSPSALPEPANPSSTPKSDSEA